MIRRFTSSSGSFASLAASAVIVPALLLATPRTAHAGLSDCGNIDVRANAQCEVQASGGCTAKCEPVNFRAACAGKLTAQCDGQCAANVDVSCTGSCEADCQGQCTASGGNLDCRGSCDASCSADCDGQCSASASGGSGNASCKAQCEANCSAKCDARCTGTPPTATCEGKCKASCQGSCEGKASAKCQIECQSKLEGSCTAQLQGGCQAQCTKPEGALFCDGQYVDTGNNLEKCIEALRATFNIQVSGSASGQCSGNQCTGEAEGSASCAASPRSASVVPELALLAMVGAAIARKARRGRR